MSVFVADAVDEITYASCDDCSVVYAMHDGWQGLCPECCAVLDDHRDGRHEVDPHAVCRACDVVDDRIELPATA
ncbi:MAG TPA: hypothetical protein VK059_06340 [Nocardioidaceae bacterium]|nr:hypothetical protein [Nocardioidaceae bacterium]